MKTILTTLFISLAFYANAQMYSKGKKIDLKDENYLEHSFNEAVHDSLMYLISTAQALEELPDYVEVLKLPNQYQAYRLSQYKERYKLEQVDLTDDGLIKDFIQDYMPKSGKKGLPLKVYELLYIKNFELNTLSYEKADFNQLSQYNGFVVTQPHLTYALCSPEIGNNSLIIAYPFDAFNLRVKDANLKSGKSLLSAYFEKVKALSMVLYKAEHTEITKN